MVDEETKQKIKESIKGRKFFTSKKVSKELNVSSHLIGRYFLEMEKEGLIKRWSKKQWTWEESEWEKNPDNTKKIPKKLTKKDP